MTTPARAPVRSGSNTRRMPRCALAVPVRVSFRGPTGPHSIPGRSLDLGEGGLSAILAGELHPGVTVAVEFLLPELGLGLHTKAVVRHQADLRCGVEFFGLSLEQQAMIRRWTRRVLEKPSTSSSAAVASATPISRTVPRPQRRHRTWLTRVMAIVALVLSVAGMVAWRYWHVGWVELQQQADSPAAVALQRVKLPPGVIETMIVHREDAVLPDGVKESTGMVLLHIVVGADGTVIDARPESGSEALTRAAMEAVREWRFQPFRMDGAPAEVETTVAVGFRQ